MTVQPRADGRYDVNDCLEDYDDWVLYREAHPDAWQGTEWGLELLVAMADAVRYGTP